MAHQKTEQETGTGRCSVEAGPAEPSVPYTVFTKAQCLLILDLASFAASFSPLSSFIFFPAINDIAHTLDVAIGRINFTIASYMIVAGLAPAFLGDLADKIGRRIIYILMMTIYCAANFGLALQRDWSALFVLRISQSAGSAGKSPLLLQCLTLTATANIAVGYGVVSDIATPSQRGSFVSVMVLG
jgi:MFS family permease